MKKTEFTFTVLFALLSGLIIGSISTCILLRPVPEKFDFDKKHAEMIIRTAQTLNLNPEQEKQFYAIYSSQLRRAYAVLRPLKPELLKILNEKMREINSILTPEQQVIFREINTEKINRFKNRFANAELVEKYFPGNAENR
ncbi:MAG: hypothetical protein PHV59_07090 [Victivallales bacterium]|nr:hypothetical protein [Victivallales bacterium]